MNKEKIHEEALCRMVQLKFSPMPINYLKEKGKICYTSKDNKYLNLTPFLSNLVSEIEKEYDSFVYHIIQTQLSDDEFHYSFLLVTSNEEEWQLDREDAIDGYVFAYVYNSKYPELSELGSIRINNEHGVAKRIA